MRFIEGLYREGRTLPWYVYVFFAWIAITIMGGIGAFYANQSVVSVMAFSFYQIFAILIPGLGYAKLFGKVKNDSGLVTIFIAYVLGYCSNIVMYYLLFWTGGMESNAIGYFLLITVQCVLSVFLLVKDKIVLKEENNNWFIPVVLIAGIFVLELFAYAGYNLLPPYTDGTNVFRDTLYWIGNAASLKMGYPPIEFRVLREDYTYHFFTSMQIAVESIVTGIPVVELSIYFSYIQAIIILVGGLYCLLTKITDRKLTIILFSVMLLFTSGYGGITRVSYVSHLYFNQYGFDYGMGVMLFLLCAMIELFESSLTWKNYFYTCIIFAALMGIKSTFACIGIVGIGCSCFYFLLKKEWKKAFVFGLSILFIFIFLYLNVCNISGYSGVDGISISKEVTVREETRLSGQPQANEATQIKEDRGADKQVNISEINIGGVIHISKFHWDVCENLAAIRETIFSFDIVPAFILEFVFFGLFVTICNPCLYILVYLTFFFKIVKREKIDYWDISCIGMMLVGMLIGLYIHMGGKSNVYFAMATYPPALLFVARNIGMQINNRNRIWLIISGCLFVFGFNLFLNHAANGPIKNYFDIGKERYTNVSDNVMLIEESQEGISTAEYEALLFVREEIENDETVVCINERTYDRNFAGVISEHKVVNCKPSNDKAMLEDVMTKWNANYLVIPYDVLVKIGFEGNEVFRNSNWCVVEVSR